MHQTRSISFGRWWGPLALGLLALVLLGWYLGSPLVLNRAVNESLPAGIATEPRPIATGSFGIVDNVHQGQGTATLLDLQDGTRILRLGQDFRVTNGPDLFVYLSTQAEPRGSADLQEPRAYEVAPLKGNIGDQNYTLPVDLNVADFSSVVIYCRRFSVVFSTAQLLWEKSNP